MIEEILAVDWAQVRFKRALSGLVAVLVAFAFISVVETVALIIVVAALFNVAAANDGPMRERWSVMAQFSIIGAIIGAVAFWSIDDAVAAAAVLGTATYLGTLIAAFGQRQARAGLFLTLWAVLAMILGTGSTAPLAVSGAFVIGGVVAIAVTAVRLWIVSEDEADDVTAAVGEAARADVAPEGSVITRLVWASRGNGGTFSLIRAFAVVASTLIGFWLFPDYAFWGAITVIIVVRPSASQTASIAVQRTLGTAVGAVFAVLAVQVFPGNEVYALAGFSVSTFFMVAFMNANYTIFAAFLTSTLVFSLRMVQADAFDAGVERVAATLVGAVISVVTVGIAHVVIRRPDSLDGT